MPLGLGRPRLAASTIAAESQSTRWGMARKVCSSTADWVEAMSAVGAWSIWAMGVLPRWSADEAGEEGVGEEEISLVAGQQEESEKDQRCAGQGHVLVEVELLHEPGLRVALGPEAVDEECGGDQEAEEAERG